MESSGNGPEVTRSSQAFLAAASEGIHAANRAYRRLRLRFVQRPLRRSPLLGPHLVKSWHVRRFLKRKSRPVRLDPPVRFSDHIVHRILRDRDPRLKIVCDKVAVRDIIRERLGEPFVVPLLGCWSDPRDIPWDTLPDRFVLKPSHSSGAVALVRGRHERDVQALTTAATAWIREDYFDVSLEWGYRELPRRIIAEPLLVGPGGGYALEALVLTFGGRAAAIRIFTGPKKTAARRDNWFDRNAKRLPFHSNNYERGDFVLPVDMATELVTAAEKVSAGFSHLRVDFYLTDHGLRIGELTPYMAAGLTPWSRPGCDIVFGQLWKDPTLIDRIGDLGAAIAAAE